MVPLGVPESHPLRAELLMDLLESRRAENVPDQTRYWRCRPTYAFAEFYARTFCQFDITFEEEPPSGDDTLFEVGWVYPWGFHDRAVHVFALSGRVTR